MKTFQTIILSITLCFLLSSITLAQQNDIVGPEGSRLFGTDVTALPNGNIVVLDPEYSIPNGTENVGAAYLYNGKTRELISTIIGSSIGDFYNSEIIVLPNSNYLVSTPYWDNGEKRNDGAVTFASGTAGVSGVISTKTSLVGTANFNSPFFINKILVLPNGNYLVSKPDWDNGEIFRAGAVTFGNGTTGVSGITSSNNSLVGSTNEDQIGKSGITILENGNYVVNSPDWDNQGVINAGAVTFGNGTTGIKGEISSENSLVGSSNYDSVGKNGVTALTNGNYVVNSPSWDNEGIDGAGAVTFGDGTTGITGTISSSNSLVGSKINDWVGNGSTTPLTNGNYVVKSYSWSNGGTIAVGAFTFGNGTTGIIGEVSEDNSLVGSSAYDTIGFWGGVTALANGNYVAISPLWNNDGIAGAGAVTFGNGTTGITGEISSENSLVGSKTDDQVGNYGVKALTNGNYVVITTSWDNDEVIDAGAVTFGNGTTGITGEVSAENSLVGSKTDDWVGLSGVTTLTNGNYLVRSPYWDNENIPNVGAVTFGDGTKGITGTVSSSNSLIGSTIDDLVGIHLITVLTNGNYVINSRYWDNGNISNAGAVTFGNGTTGVNGIISNSNSLVGDIGQEHGHNALITALTNGNYIVSSSLWGKEKFARLGAVTFGDGTTGIKGEISVDNSFVGSKTDDRISHYGRVKALTNGNYVFESRYWDNGEIIDAGAVTILSGTKSKHTLSSHKPVIDMSNSVIGNAEYGGHFMDYAYDEFNKQLVVGRPYENIVTFFKPSFLNEENIKLTGKVITSNEKIISNAIVKITNSKGETKITRVNQFGNFNFEELENSEMFIITAMAKGYNFIPTTINLENGLNSIVIKAK